MKADYQQLINKYNKPVPRYTSYPPANQFSAPMHSDEFSLHLLKSNDCEPQNISLYFHIPFCRKRCLYCGCNAYALHNDREVEEYVSALIREMSLVKAQLNMERKVSQVHFGGGTPNDLSLPQLSRIMEKISELFSYADNPEIAMECNPAYLNSEYIEALAFLGFNRISLGIQDFDPKVLKSVNRDASQLPYQELVEIIRSKISGVSVNFDFIYGLPHQTPASFESNMEQAISLKPDRLVTFSYAHMPSVFKRQAVLDKVGIPGPSEKIEMFQRAYSMMLENGYRAIGFDHYAREDDELSIAQEEKMLHRNFQGYCTRKSTGQVYAFGVSAITQLENMYAQTTKIIPDYIEHMQKGKFLLEKSYVLKPEDKIVREVINELMCNLQVSFKEIAERRNSSIEKIKNSILFIPEILDGFKADQILEYSDDGILLKKDGVLFTRNVAASLDPGLKAANKLFSRSV